jgi:orotate phosphoribosyltransferase
MLTTDRGLCGPVNSSLARALRKELLAAAKDKKDVRVVTLGDKGRAQIARDYVPVMARSFDNLFDKDANFALASAVALTSHLRGTPKDAVYVRKDAKDHGSKRLLEGDAQLPSGASLVILEDVSTTGGSTLKAVTKLRDAGYRVHGVIALVDRLEGGREAIEAASLHFVALYTRRDFIPDA